MNIVFVTNNQNKLSEINNLVSSNYNILSLKDIDFHNDIDETENTLEGNAMLKAKCIHSRFGLDCFADDTGLEIDVLDGRPGVYSARYAGPQCNAKDNIDKVLSELKYFENRSAKFITVIALILNGKQFFFKGECKGYITKIPRGKDGFGYDPIFQPLKSKLTFAEMNQSEKGKISHRGIAVKKLIDFLNKQNN